MLHHDGSFLIDDRAVERARLAEVVEGLPDGVRARRPVHGIRRRVVGKEEAEVVVHLGKGGVDDLRRHEIGEDLFRPHVVEPVHRHEVAEPHVGGLVGDEGGAPEELVLGGRGVEHEARLPVEDRAGMLHAAVLKRGDEHEVELVERVRDAGVVFEPRQRRRVEVEDGVAVAGELFGVGLAVIHRHRPPVAHGGLRLEAARGEGEEVRRERLRLGEAEGRAVARRVRLRDRPVRHGLPAFGHVEREAEPRLQVRLVEDREGKAGAVGDEERVEEVVVPVERALSRDEADGDRVLPFDERRRGKDEVVVLDGVVGPFAVHVHAEHVPRRGVEVEHERVGGVAQAEADDRLAGDAVGAGGGDGEADVIADVGERAGAVLGELPRDAGAGVGHGGFTAAAREEHERGERREEGTHGRSGWVGRGDERKPPRPG